MTEERPWEIWDEARAVHYRKNYGTPQRPEKRHSARMRLAASLIVGDSVLDVGCGLGHLYPLIPGKTYLGLDTSHDMLEEARRLTSEASFRYGDIYDLSKHGEYDTVICQSLLIHLPEIASAITEMWKHTRRALVFSVPIGPKQSIKTVKKFGGGKALLMRTESQENIDRIIEALPSHGEVTSHLEPGTGIGNTYTRILNTTGGHRK